MSSPINNCRLCNAKIEKARRFCDSCLAIPKRGDNFENRLKVLVDESKRKTIEQGRANLNRYKGGNKTRE